MNYRGCDQEGKNVTYLWTLWSHRNTIKGSIMRSFWVYFCCLIILAEGCNAFTVITHNLWIRKTEHWVLVSEDSLTFSAKSSHELWGKIIPCPKVLIILLNDAFTQRWKLLCGLCWKLVHNKHIRQVASLVSWGPILSNFCASMQPQWNKCSLTLTWSLWLLSLHLPTPPWKQCTPRRLLYWRFWWKVGQAWALRPNSIQFQKHCHCKTLGCRD